MQVAISEYLPDSGETTATALLAAVMNFAGTSFVSTFSGAALLDALGIKRGSYANLPWAILIRTLARLLPIPFIPFLIPAGSSLDKTRSASERYGLDDLPEKGAEKKAATEQELAAVDGGKGAGGTRTWRIFKSMSSSLYLAEPESPPTPKADLPPSGEAPEGEDSER